MERDELESYLRDRPRRLAEHLEGVEAKRREALIEAMGKALDAITSQDVEGFFRHCGYQSAGQLL